MENVDQKLMRVKGVNYKPEFVFFTPQLRPQSQWFRCHWDNKMLNLVGKQRFEYQKWSMSARQRPSAGLPPTYVDASFLDSKLEFTGKKLHSRVIVPRKYKIGIVTKIYVRYYFKSDIMIQEGLVIDRDVRNWVLIPLTLSVMLLMLLRQYASVVSI